MPSPSVRLGYGARNRVILPTCGEDQSPRRATPIPQRQERADLEEPLAPDVSISSLVPRTRQTVLREKVPAVAWRIAPQSAYKVTQRVHAVIFTQIIFVWISFRTLVPVPASLYAARPTVDVPTRVNFHS